MGGFATGASRVPDALPVRDSALNRANGLSFASAIGHAGCRTVFRPHGEFEFDDDLFLGMARQKGGHDECMHQAKMDMG